MPYFRERMVLEILEIALLAEQDEEDGPAG